MQVPQLVGLAVVEAHDLALDVGVLAVDVRRGRGLDGHGDQAASAAGRLVTAGACVHIWVARDGPDDNADDDDGPGGGGGGGDRAPLGPPAVDHQRQVVLGLRARAQ